MRGRETNQAASLAFESTYRILPTRTGASIFASPSHGRRTQSGNGYSVLRKTSRKEAREIFVHRGTYGARAPQAEVKRIWTINTTGNGRRYKIDRQHDVAALVRRRLPSDSRALLDALFDLIERTVPIDRVWLDVTENGPPAGIVAQDEAELLKAAREMVQLMEAAGCRDSGCSRSCPVDGSLRSN